MPPRKKAPGPRPKRAAPADKRTAPDKPSSNSPPLPTSKPRSDGLPMETTTNQSPLEDSVAVCSGASNQTETVPPEPPVAAKNVTIGKPEASALPETRKSRETLAREEDEGAQSLIVSDKLEKLNDDGDGEKGGLSLGLRVRKTKIVKKKVVKVVKKLVKKRVPKASLRRELSACPCEVLAIAEPDNNKLGNKEETLDAAPDGNMTLAMEEAQNSQGLNGGAGASGGSKVSEPGLEVGKLESLVTGPIDNVTILMVSTNTEDKMVEESVEVGGFKGMDACEGGKECSSKDVGMKGEEYGVMVDNSDSATDRSVETMEVNVGRDGNDVDREIVVEERSGHEERGKELFTGDDGEKGGGCSGIVFSGELEALERRRRRKTEIYIGGLSADTKEDDIRTIFEEVGEVLEVRLVTNSKTGNNKGYAFVRYALAADAQKALEKHRKVEISGKQCKTAPVEGNDTIFLGNIDKKWKNEDVLKLLQEIGIQKIDKVTVMTDPTNPERNRGFAFLELQTSKDAQIAFKILQKKDLLGRLKNVKVAWAEPLSEPDEEEMSKVKTVYAEYLPSSWDEEKVRNYFKKFGEIENVVLARNLHSSKRKDFAFINFGSREAALACIESFNQEMLHDDGSEVNVRVSLAKPVPKGKPHKKVSKPTSFAGSKQKQMSIQHTIEPMENRKGGIPSAYNNNDTVDFTISSGSARLEQLLAERALWRQTQARLGLLGPDYSHAVNGQKRPLSSLDDEPYHVDHREYSRFHAEGSFHDHSLSHGEFPPSLSYSQRQDSNFASGYEYMDHAWGYRREGPHEHASGRYPYRYG